MPSTFPPPKALLAACYHAAVAQAQAAGRLAAYLPAPPAQGRTLVLGAGKAAAAMVQALEAAWPADAPLSGLVVTRYGHVPPRPPGLGPARVEVVQAAHPVPDAAGLAAAQRMLALTRGLQPQDLVICLLSGGASALLCCPAPGVAFAHKQALTRALLASGARIDEINCVRKHLSALKGGRLGLACAPAQLHTVLISDVPGDDVSVIASGPTVGDPSSCADALAVLARYAIAVPPGVHAALASGALETPQPSHPYLQAQRVVCMATPAQALAAAARHAQMAGLHVQVLGDALAGC